MNNWKKICEDFSGHRGKEYQKYWEKQGFDYQSTKKWKEVLKRDFKFSDFSFCTWLRDEKHLAAEVSLQTGDLEKLRKEYQKLWIDINGDFSHYASLGKTYQQLWEERGNSSGMNKFRLSARWLLLSWRLKGPKFWFSNY